MARHDFTAQIVDDHFGLIVVPDVECKLAVLIDHGEEPEVTVTGVWIEDAKRRGLINLTRSTDKLLRLFAAEIIRQADEDLAWKAGVLEAEGYQWRGLGANDPDAHWQQVAF